MPELYCKICVPHLTGNGYCAEHSSSGKAYFDDEIKILLLEDRLKTLEDKVKFIMKHACFVADVKIDDETLQDLWDEENKMTEFEFHPPVEVKTGVEYEVKTCINCKEPTVKECDCLCHRERGTVPYPETDCKCKLTDKNVKMAIEEFDKQKRNSQNTIKPTDNSEKIEHDPKVETYNCPACIKDQKIEEIMKEYDKHFLFDMFSHKEYKYTLGSWLRDKLKNL